jgi:hypothetical protein
VKKRVVRARLTVDTGSLIEELLVAAVERGMNRCDKYATDREDRVPEYVRRSLLAHVVESFNLAAADRGVEFR